MYVVFTDGVSNTVDETAAKGIQVYVAAPLAVNVTVPPAHNAVDVAAIEIEGAAFTLIVIV